LVGRKKKIIYQLNKLYASFFFSNSSFNLAYDLLNHIYGGNLTKPSTSTSSSLAGKFVTIDQTALMNPEAVTTTDSEDADIFSYWAKWLKTTMAIYDPFNTLSMFKLPGAIGASSIDGSGFDKEGFVYYPENCANGKKCPIHVALHGCAQGLDHCFAYV
jgi:hypothetical protein